MIVGYNFWISRTEFILFNDRRISRLVEKISREREEFHLVLIPTLHFGMENFDSTGGGLIAVGMIRGGRRGYAGDSDKQMQFRFKIKLPFPLSRRQWISNAGNGPR